MTTLSSLQDAKYIALETFRQNGQGVITPVWQTPQAGKLYVWTEANSWKVKRIRRNPRVRVCVSDARGNPESEWAEAQATILTSNAAIARQKQQLAAKYGLFFRFFQVMSMLRRAEYVVIELAA